MDLFYRDYLKRGCCIAYIDCCRGMEYRVLDTGCCDTSQLPQVLQNGDVIVASIKFY